MTAAAALTALVIMSASGCGGSGNDDATRVNGSIHIRAGTPPGPASTVNGGVEIDPNSSVTQAKTVNGEVHLGARAQAASLTSVNGGITLEAGSRVAESVQTVNGRLILREGASVGGSIENVTGVIQLNSAQVTGGIKTVTGDIDLEGNSRIEHGIRVEKPSGTPFGTGMPKVVIGPGTTVEGELRFDRPVRLFVSNRARIGPVVGATAIPFDGDSPQ